VIVVNPLFRLLKMVAPALRAVPAGAVRVAEVLFVYATLPPLLGSPKLYITVLRVTFVIISMSPSLYGSGIATVPEFAAPGAKI
jgi:hypothetical protein